ncbi:MAG: ankyrin repeat domain-containing protein [Steroidobacteraceae bacterium]|jgi:ankyrin repeat protein
MSGLTPIRRLLTAICCALLVANALPSAAAAAARQMRVKDPLEGARTALRLLQFDKAIELLGSLGRAGNPDAQYLLALMYLNGVGTGPDPVRARALLQSAAEHGQGAAAYVLAAELGRDPGASPAAAHSWLQRSAQLGYVRAVDVLKSGKPLLEREPLGASDPALFTAWVMSCVSRGDGAEIRRLGAAAAGVTDEFGRSPLSFAAQRGQFGAAAALIDLGADVRTTDRFGTTALMLAAQQTEPALVELLLAHGADSQPLDAEKRTALFYAARADRPAAVQLLLRAGALPGARDERGYTALDAALTVGADAAASELRSQGVQHTVVAGAASRQAGKFDPAHPGDLYRGWAPLAVAVSRDDTSAVEQLLAAGGDVNLRLPQGDPLIRAAMDAHALGSLSLLLKRGAKPTAQDHSGHSVLWLAATRGDLIVLQALLEDGVPADAHAVGEQRPLLAALRAANPEGARQLLDAGASIDASDGKGHTPLMLAAAAGEATVVRTLLAHHAQVDAKDDLDRTALWYAASAGSRDVVTALLGAGARPDAIDARGLSPLHAAAGQPNAAVLEPLLASGSVIDRRSLLGDTPLLIAAAGGHDEVAQVLLARSAGLDLQNSAGDTALIAASRGGHSHICHQLLAAGANRALRNGAGVSAEDVASGRGFASIAHEIAGKT